MPGHQQSVSHLLRRFVFMRLRSPYVSKGCTSITLRTAPLTLNTIELQSFHHSPSLAAQSKLMSALPVTVVEILTVITTLAALK